MRNRVPVLAAALAFALVISAVALLAGRSGDDLPRLAYTDNLAPPGAAGERSSTAAADMALMPYSVEYQLATELDKPADTAPAYRIVAPTSADVAGLAQAFGLSAPVEEDGAWVARDAGSNELRVDKLGSWYFGVSRDTAVGSDDTAVNSKEAVARDALSGSTVRSSSAVAVGECAPCPPDRICTMDCRPPERPAGVPTVAEAEIVARELWLKAGIEVGDAKVDAQDGWDSVFVRFTPQIDGQAVMGLDQSVGVGVDKKITFANGWLLELDKLGDYPLIDPADAVARFGKAGYMGGREPAPLPGTDTPAQIAPVPDSGSGSGSGAATRPADATTSSGSGTSAGSTGSAGSTDPASPPPTGQPEPDLGTEKPYVVDPEPLPVPEPGPVPQPELRIVKLTAVRLGLQFTGESILPVYVFTTESGDDAPPVPAVPDRYLVKH